MNRPERARSLRERALEALKRDVPEGAVRSFFASAGDFLLLADKPTSGDGAELFAEYSADSATDALDVPFEFYSNGRAIFSGVWTTELRASDAPIAPDGQWETLCEDFADSYGYCERSLPLQGGRRFSRRLLLAYSESLLFVVDELVAGPDERRDPPRLEYRVRFPLAPEIESLDDRDAREIVLRRTTVERSKRANKKNGADTEEEALLTEIANEPVERTETLAKVFPIGLPEWREDASRGEFRTVDRALELTTTREGAVLFAPFVVDLNARRATRQCAWGRLTVGEEMRAVGEDEAVGAKLQLGREQYILYASTSPRPAIRSILSKHLNSDFMVGKFSASRGVEPILDVDIVAD